MEAMIKKKVEKFWNELIRNYDLKISCSIPYELNLENKDIRIILSFNRYYDEFNTFFFDKINEKRYAIINIMFKKKLMGIQVMNDSELALSKKLPSDLDRILFTEMILLNKFCKDLLSGDFSVMN